MDIQQVTTKKFTPNADGSRGSFFASGTRRHRPHTHDQEQHAHDHLRYLKDMMDTPAETEDVPRETLATPKCECYADHDFDIESHIATMQCKKCGIVCEHFMKSNAILGITPHADYEADATPEASEHQKPVDG